MLADVPDHLKDKTVQEFTLYNTALLVQLDSLERIVSQGTRAHSAFMTNFIDNFERTRYPAAEDLQRLEKQLLHFNYSASLEGKPLLVNHQGRSVSDLKLVVRLNKEHLETVLGALESVSSVLERRTIMHRAFIAHEQRAKQLKV